MCLFCFASVILFDLEPHLRHEPAPGSLDVVYAPWFRYCWRHPPLPPPPSRVGLPPGNQLFFRMGGRNSALPRTFCLWICRVQKRGPVEQCFKFLTHFCLKNIVEQLSSQLGWGAKQLLLNFAQHERDFLIFAFYIMAEFFSQKLAEKVI